MFVKHVLVSFVSTRTDKLAKHEAVLKATVDNGLTGSVLPVRAAATAWTKLKMSIVNGGRSHVRIRASQVQRKPGTLADSEEYKALMASLAVYMVAAQKVTSAGENAVFWTAEDVQTKVNELFSAVSELDSQHAVLSAAWEAIQKIKDSARLDQIVSLRKKSVALAKELRPYADKGIAPSWAGKMLEIGAVQTIGANIHYLASSNPRLDNVTEWDKPVWFAPNEAKTGARC